MSRITSLRGALLAAALLSVGACDQSYEGIEMSRVGGHRDASLSQDLIRVPEGGLVAIEAQLETGGSSDYNALDELEFRSTDCSVVRVVQGLKAHTWMMLGETEGRAIVEVVVNGKVEDTVEVEVDEQKEEPSW